MAGMFLSGPANSTSDLFAGVRLATFDAAKKLIAFSETAYSEEVLDSRGARLWG